MCREPLWVQFSALLPEHPIVVPTHPLGCHRARVSDRLDFEHFLAALVHGSGYERIASTGCSDRTIRRRLREWAALGLAEEVRLLALQAYERMIGLDLLAAALVVLRRLIQEARLATAGRCLPRPVASSSLPDR